MIHTKEGLIRLQREPLFSYYLRVFCKSDMITRNFLYVRENIG